ncbi:MAG: Transcription factor spt20 [Chrysothrix sp. TS-e1954]|nr:MAG: Transcription factor spt20 [Chrysothrix sp. TS-e1954]
MATAVSVRPPSTSSKLGRPLPPPLHTASINSESSLISASSPSIPNRATPSSATFTPGLGTNGDSSGIAVARTRQRQRPSQSKARQSTDDTPRPPKRKLVEPYVRTTEYILHKFRDRPPSLVVHLHPTYFRFDQQDGSFRYDSPMRLILEHIKAQTVPHDILEELFQGNTPFYDGCLIVEIHDHKTSPIRSSHTHSDANNENSVPFSIHNYNQYITPSPFVPYPHKQRDAQSRTNGPRLEGENKEEGKGSMAAPERPSRDYAKRPDTFTTVLHPTSLSRHREITILATTALPDSRPGGRKSLSKDGATPASALPPTPLSSLPSTPTTSSKSTPKRQKMLLDDKEVHSFEAELLRSTEAPLFLDPVEDFGEAQAVMKMLTHPLHNYTPSMPKGRKRTTAQLAADEALAAEEERMALIMDERLEPSLGNGVGADGANQAKHFEPNFASFKRLEEIRRHHEEVAKKRKEDEQLMQITKRQHQEQQAEQLRRRNAEMQRQQNNAEMARAQAQQAAQAQQQAQHQRMLYAQAQRQAQMQAQSNQASQMHPGMMQNMQQNGMQHVSQAPHSSPAMSHHSPVNTSPMINNAMQGQQTNHIVPSTPGHGPENSPRPGSAMHARSGMAAHMARQVSQQNSQAGQSRNGTPQMQNATPHPMNASINGRMTPQMNMSQNSPVASAMQGTPMMPPATMSAPQMNGQQPNMLTPQQIQHQNAMRQQRAFQQAQMHGSAQTGLNPGQMSAAQKQAFMQQQHLRAAQQNGQNPSATMKQTAAGGMTIQQQQAILQSMTPEQRQEYLSKHPGRLSQNASNTQQSAQEYSRRLSEQMAAMQQSQGQGAMQNMNMQQRQRAASQLQGSPAFGGQNGVPMSQSMSQQNVGPQVMQQQRNGMQVPQQMGGNMSLQQQQHARALQQQMQQQRSMFFQNLAKQHGGQLPPNAEQLFQAKRIQVATQHHQNQMRQAQMNGQQPQLGQGMLDMAGQNPGPQGSPNHMRLNPQQQQMHQQQLQQQRMRMMQAQQQQGMRPGGGMGQQNMMNGMSPGQGGG